MPEAGSGRNQALRTALSLCALADRPLLCRGLVDDNPRPKPGLGPGHVTLARALATVTGGVWQADLGEEQLAVEPGAPTAGDYDFDMSGERQSAAPLSWILETLLLPLAAAPGPSSLYLAGGTHVMGGATSDEIRQVLVPDWRLLGLDVDYIEVTPGFYPEGGGEAEARVEPCSAISPLVADDEFKPVQVGLEVLSSGLPVHLAEQALEGALARLELHGLKPLSRLRKARGGVGMALLVWAQDKNGLRVGFNALGRRGGRPEALATEAVESLMAFLKSGAGLPASLAAQLLAVMACARGQSRFSVEAATRELKGAIKGVEALWPGTVRLYEDPQGGPVLLRVMGRDLGRAV
jgi:RNA 3'-phosphate cyclase